MKKVTVSLQKLQLLLIFIFSISIQAQDKEFESPLKEGAWALQFGIAPNFTLQSYQGSFISAKYMLNKSEGISFGCSFGLSKSNEDEDAIQKRIDTITGNSSRDRENVANDISLNIQYLKHKTSLKSITFVFGGGVILGYSFDKRIQVNSDESRIVTSKNKTYSWNTGVSTNIGVEWFVSNSISIMANYNARFLYTWGQGDAQEKIEYLDSDELTINYRDTEYDGYELFNSYVLFGASIYF